VKSVCITLWRKFLVNANETWLTYLDENSDFDIYPNIGVIGTPVIDRTGGAIYVVYRSKTTTGTSTYFQRLHALNITDGTEKLNGRALNTSLSLAAGSHKYRLYVVNTAGTRWEKTVNFTVH
jgi:hypothetical protein